MDPAELRQGGFQHRFHRGTPCDIDFDCDRSTAGLAYPSGCPLGCVSVDVRCHHSGPFARQAGCTRRTNAAARAGHDCIAFVEPPRHHPVVLYGRAIAQRIKGTPGITG